MTNAEARCNKSLRPRKPEGSLGRTAQDVHLDSHTAPELICSDETDTAGLYITMYNYARGGDSSVVRAPDSWSKDFGIESRQEQRKSFISRISFLFLCEWLLFRSTPVLARKWAWGMLPKVQLAGLHEATSHGAHRSSFTWHQPCKNPNSAVSTP